MSRARSNLTESEPETIEMVTKILDRISPKKAKVDESGKDEIGKQTEIV